MGLVESARKEARPFTRSAYSVGISVRRTACPESSYLPKVFIESFLTFMDVAPKWRVALGGARKAPYLLLSQVR